MTSYYNINNNDINNLIFNERLDSFSGYTNNFVVTDVTGTYLVSALSNVSSNTTTIKHSTNGGIRWISAGTIDIAINSIASNSTGQYLIAGGSISTGQTVPGVYISSNYGASWTFISLTASDNVTITGVAISSNGLIMHACANMLSANTEGYWSISSGGGIANSVFFGTINNFKSICCSGDGLKVYICSNVGYKIGTYSTSTQQTTIVNGATINGITNSFVNISCSNDGTNILLTSLSNGTYVSSNSGTSFTSVTGLPTSTSYSNSIISSCFVNRYTNTTYSYSPITIYFSNYNKTTPSGQIYIYNGSSWSQLSNTYSNYLTSFLSVFNNGLILNNYSNSYIYIINSTNSIVGTDGTTSSNTNFSINNVDLKSLLFSTFRIIDTTNTTTLSRLSIPNLRTGYSININNTSIDLGNLILPYYNIYTSTTTSISFPSYNGSTYYSKICVILIGGGGGGGSGGATKGGLGGSGGGGGGGAIAIFSINYVSGQNTFNITIGSGGSGGAVLTGNNTGNNGSTGGSTSITYNSITYTVFGGSGGYGGGGSTSGTTPSTTSNGGTGGTGGSTFTNIDNTNTTTTTVTHNGIAGSDGLKKNTTSTPNAVMGGIGGFCGNYNVTYNMPSPVSNGPPSSSITFTSGNNYFINDTKLNLINNINVNQNGSGVHNAPTIIYSTYYGQGGYGGNSDQSTTGDYGYAVSSGQPGLAVIYGLPYI